jgi:hypothetical protein
MTEFVKYYQEPLVRIDVKLSVIEENALCRRHLSPTSFKERVCRGLQLYFINFREVAHDPLKQLVGRGPNYLAT